MIEKVKKARFVALFSVCFLIVTLNSACLGFRRRNSTPTISIDHKLFCSKGVVRKIVVLPFITTVPFASELSQIDCGPRSG